VTTTLAAAATAAAAPAAAAHTPCQAQQDKTRYEREMETWRSELEVTTTTAAAAAADSAAADAAAADADAAAAAAAAAAGVGSPDAMDVDPATVAAVAAAVVKAEQRSATPPRSHHPKIKLKMHGPSASRGTPPPPAAAPRGGGYAGSAEHGLLPQMLHTGGEFGSGGGAAVSPTLPAAEPYLQPVSVPAAVAAPASPVLGGAAGVAADGMAVDAHAPPGMHAAGPGGDMQL
jgi:hypothetical protein